MARHRAQRHHTPALLLTYAVLGTLVTAAALWLAQAEADAPTGQPAPVQRIELVTGNPQPEAVVQPPNGVPAPIATTTTTPKPAPTTRPPAKPRTSPPTYAPPASTATVELESGVTAWCSNGYLHPDGSCSSTPEWPTFSQPTGSACAGTASQCLDALTGEQNSISRMLGSGTGATS